MKYKKEMLRYETMDIQKPKLRQSTLSFSSKSGSLSYGIKHVVKPLSSPTESNNILSLDDSNSGSLNKIEMSPGQRRLNDLKGVWIIEQINEYNEKLIDPTTSSKEKIDIIQQLLDKSPSTEMIQSTGIGDIIKSIAKSKHDQENIQSVSLIKESMKLYRHWKRLAEKRVDQNLVTRMANLNTTERQNQVKKLEEACRDCIYKESKEKEIENESNLLNRLANSIEKSVYSSSGNFIGSYYRRIIQNIVSDIEENKLGWCQKILIVNEQIRQIETKSKNIDQVRIVTEKVQELLSAYDLFI